MAALGRGVPLLCTPMGRDQFFNADALSRTGMAEVLEPAAATLGDPAQPHREHRDQRDGEAFGQRSAIDVVEDMIGCGHEHQRAN